MSSGDAASTRRNPAGLLILLGVVLLVVLVTYLPSVGRDDVDHQGRAVVHVWSWNIAGDALIAVTDDFETIHPDTDVRIEKNGTMSTSRLLLSMVAGKGGPDVAQLQEREAERFTRTGRIVKLTDWAGRYENDFPQSFWQSCVYEGDVYAIPWDIGPVAVYYKRWIFERYNIDPDTIETWDDFIRVGEQITSQSGGATAMMPMLATELQDFLQIFMQQNGGGVFNEQGQIVLHQRANVEALELIGRLLQSPATRPGSMYSNEFLASLGADTTACFVGPAWQSANVKDYSPPELAGQWGILRLPAMRPGGVRNSNFGGSVLVIPESSSQQPPAEQFIEYALCTVPGQIEQFKKYGLFPAYLPAHDDPFFQEPDPFYGGQKINAIFAQDFENVPPMIRTSDWTEAQRLMTQWLIQFAEKPTDASGFLKRMSDELAARTGRDIGDVQ